MILIINHWEVIFLRVHILDTGDEGLDKILSWLSENKAVKEVLVLKKPLDFLEKVEKEKPELVFIWIGTTDISGLNIGRRIKAMNSQMRLVFISVDKDYAIDAYDIGAYGYLLYPLEKKKFDKMLTLIKESFHMDSIKEYLEKRRR